MGLGILGTTVGDNKIDEMEGCYLGVFPKPSLYPKEQKIIVSKSTKIICFQIFETSVSCRRNNDKEKVLCRHCSVICRKSGDQSSFSQQPAQELCGQGNEQELVYTGFKTDTFTVSLNMRVIMINISKMCSVKLTE